MEIIFHCSSYRLTKQKLYLSALDDYEADLELFVWTTPRGTISMDKFWLIYVIRNTIQSMPSC